MSALVRRVSHAYRDAADKLGLKKVPPAGSSEDVFSIYDGSRFVFQQSTWSVVTLWRMVQRYWLTYFTFSAPKQMLQKFLRLYDLQRQGITFDTPEAFLSELKLYDLTQQSMHDYLKVTADATPIGWQHHLASCLQIHKTCDDTNVCAYHGASLRFEVNQTFSSSEHVQHACMSSSAYQPIPALPLLV